MKVLIINSISGKGSTGRIVEGIADVLLSRNHEVRIAYGLGYSSCPYAHKFGSKAEQSIHKCLSHAFDMQGLGSHLATRKLIRMIKGFKPDLINIHTIHGNYINYPMLFNFLKRSGIKVVWTLHDCWTFTGHCPHFVYHGCYKWRDGECHDCPQLSMYPKSDFLDGSRRNFRLKKKYFTGLSQNLTIVAVSDWLGELVKQSFFSNTDIHILHNGINLDQFNIVRSGYERILSKYDIPDRDIVLAVASPWSQRKGWNDILKLRDFLDPGKYVIVVVGVSDAQQASLPSGIIGIPRTESVDELKMLYSSASVLINPTYEDCFPTVNLEALGCGTPVITYRTGGSPEAISSSTGVVVEQGNVPQLARAVEYVCTNKDEFSEAECRRHALKNFRQEDAFAKYAYLFESIPGPNR